MRNRGSLSGQLHLRLTPGLLVIPRHPPRRVLRYLLRVFLQFHEVIKRIDTVQFAGMNETHEKVAYRRPIFSLIEQTILSMQNGFLQSPLNNVVVQWSTGLAEKKRQALPMFQAIRDRGSQTGVWFDFLLRKLSPQPGV